jgi:hypothetical protein
VPFDIPPLRVPDPTQSILLLHVTAKTAPAVTASLTKILGEQNIEILDINQTVIHKTPCCSACSCASRRRPNRQRC